MADYQTVKVSVEDRTAILTVDNPPANAFNRQQMQDLEALAIPESFCQGFYAFQ